MKIFLVLFDDGDSCLACDDWLMWTTSYSYREARGWERTSGLTDDIWCYFRRWPHHQLIPVTELYLLLHNIPKPPAK